MNSISQIIIYLFVFIFSADLRAQNQIVADLSQDNVEISTDFLAKIEKL